MAAFITVLKTINSSLTLVLKVICIILLAVLTLIITANIIVRYIPFMSLHWLDEIVEICFAALVFYGTAAVWMVRGHFSAGDWISKLLKNPRANSFYRLIIALCSLLFIIIFFIYSLKLTLEAQEMTNVFQIPKFYLYVCMPISAGIMAVYSVLYVILEIIGIISPKINEMLKVQFAGKA